MSQPNEMQTFWSISVIVEISAINDVVNVKCSFEDKRNKLLELVRLLKGLQGQHVDLRKESRNEDNVKCGHSNW